MRYANINSWDDLTRRELRGERLEGLFVLGFVVLVVFGLAFGL